MESIKEGHSYDALAEIFNNFKNIQYIQTSFVGTNEEAFNKNSNLSIEKRIKNTPFYKSLSKFGYTNISYSLSNTDKIPKGQLSWYLTVTLGTSELTSP